MNGLAGVLLDRETGSGAVLRDGIVAAVSPLTVTVPPSTVASRAAKLDSYSARVGDFVQVLVQGANRLVIGAIGGTWRLFTPTVSGTGWALGNGTVVGAFTEIGSTVTFYLAVTFGTTSTFGSASLRIGNLPFDLANTSAAHGFSATIFDSSFTTYSLGHAIWVAGSTVLIAAPNDASQWIDTSSTIPMVWAVNDGVIVTGTYQR